MANIRVRWSKRGKENERKIESRQKRGRRKRGREDGKEG